MRKPFFGVFAFSVSALMACGGSEPAPVAPVGPAPSAAPEAASVSAPPAAPAVPAAVAEPTPEEKKKAEAMSKLAADRSKWDDERKAELERWTPELHASAKALASTSFPSGRAAIRAAMAGSHRKPGNSARDKYRHPVETLELFGFKPTLTVLEVDPGEGWYTELLAPALAAKGKLLVTTSDPNGPADSRNTFGAQRYQAFLDKAPELYGKVAPVVVDQKAPALGPEGSVDLVVVMRAVHGMVNDGTFDAWLSAIQSVLKPGGVLGVEEHRAALGGDATATAKKGYVPEKWLIEEVESKGFKLAGRSEVNANPKDTKDYPEGVWTLPPSFRLEAKDHEKYATIGESDRMTLKFVKERAKPAAKKE